MKSLSAVVIAASLAFGVPAALADDLIIAPEIGIKFHDDVKVKKYKSHKYDHDLAVGTVITDDPDIEYYDVPEDIVVAQEIEFRISDADALAMSFPAHMMEPAVGS